jgi:DNA-binding beta-propeller fold protein YncE
MSPIWAPVFVAIFALLVPPLAAQPELPYKPVAGWGELPEGYESGAGMAVAVDQQGGVWFYNRGSHPLIQFSSDGSLIQSWKEDKTLSTHQVAAHGIAVGPDGGIWLVARDSHTVYKYSPAGRTLLMIGGFAASTGSNEAPYAFDRPAGVAHDSKGNVYIADGYRNTRIVKYDASGKYVTHWGGPGAADGQFNLVHGVALDSQDRLYAVDRGNKRIQVFDTDGKHLATWNGLGTPWNLAFDGHAGVLWMCDGDLGRISKLSLEGEVLGWFGTDGSEPGQLHQVHSIAVDASGAIYAAETVNGRMQKFVRED